MLLLIDGYKQLICNHIYLLTFTRGRGLFLIRRQTRRLGWWSHNPYSSSFVPKEESNTQTVCHSVLYSMSNVAIFDLFQIYCIMFSMQFILYNFHIRWFFSVVLYHFHSYVKKKITLGLDRRYNGHTSTINFAAKYTRWV